MVSIMSHRYIVKVDYTGSVMYYKNGQRHRDGDKPAVIRVDGTVWYYKDDELHRDGDLPARIWADGSAEYWKNGIGYGT